MTCKDCKPTVWCFMHNHSGEWCRDREYLVELCAVHALAERLAERLREFNPACELLKEYDAAEKEKL